MQISNFIIPSLTIVIIIYGLIKKINIFDSFIEGVKEGLNLSLTIFPTIFAMVISINIFLKSNIIYDISSLLSPLLTKIHLNESLLPLIIMRPISGSSSLAILANILSTYGPDSFIGRVASVIQGSTDTTIYIIGLYFGSVGVKKIKHSLILGLFCDLLCVIIAILVVINLY